MPGEDLTEEEIEAKVAAAKDVAVVDCVNSMLKAGISRNVERIRLVGHPTGAALWFDEGGAWYEQAAPGPKLVEGIFARLKILAALDFAGKGKPEVGNFELRIRGARMSFQVVLKRINGEEELLITVIRGSA